jgi:hypothetical protein
MYMHAMSSKSYREPAGGDKQSFPTADAPALQEVMLGAATCAVSCSRQISR